jgi:hypothetical protein
MAIASQFLPFLDACRDLGGIQSPLWVLGSQQFAGSNRSVPELMRDRYGVVDYVDFDLNDDAAVRLDLTKPLPPERVGGAGTVLDSGTIEHILDLRSVLENVHLMIRPGGTFVALSPINWWNHAFVNFNPRLFHAFAGANGYEVVYEMLIFRLRAPIVGERYMHVVMRERGERRLRATLWVNRVMHRMQPAKTIYGCCMQKTENRPFEVPTDVFGESLERGALRSS